MFSGIGVSRGLAIGEIHVLRRDGLDIEARALKKSELAEEVRRLKRALKSTRVQLRATRESIPKDAPSDVSAFIDSHLLMLDDNALSQTPIDIIKTEQINAEAALKQQQQALVSVFEAMDDAYIATRVDDVKQVITLILQALSGGADPLLDPDAWKDRIVVADDLTPADTVIMQNHGVAGFVTEQGGQLSHTAILARSLGIPAVVGLHKVRKYLKNGETVTLDGSSGLLVAEPTEEHLTQSQQRQKEARKIARELSSLIDQESITLDGTPLGLWANIEVDDDVKALKRVNAAGVGLFRTEFMYMNRKDPPTEQEHLKEYSKILRALKGAPLTIRTIDLGGDKMADSVHDSGPLVHNPAMGLRGIRLALNNLSLFVPQLRAILRASAKGPVRLLIPMLTNRAEITQVRELIEEIKSTLDEEGLTYDPEIQIGGMIEVPAAAIAASTFATDLDFLSIGTNDLIQYTLAIDRIDDQVHYLYDPLHPAVLQLIQTVIRAGRDAGIPVTLCGEMAGDPEFVRVLLGLGLTEFSMPPKLLLAVKQMLIQSKVTRLKPMAQKIIHAPDVEAQHHLLGLMNKPSEKSTKQSSKPTGKSSSKTKAKSSAQSNSKSNNKSNSKSNTKSNTKISAQSTDQAANKKKGKTKSKSNPNSSDKTAKTRQRKSST